MSGEPAKTVNVFFLIKFLYDEAARVGTRRRL
jgi:hypothetical protein